MKLEADMAMGYRLVIAVASLDRLPDGAEGTVVNDPQEVEFYKSIPEYLAGTKSGDYTNLDDDDTNNSVPFSVLTLAEQSSRNDLKKAVKGYDTHMWGTSSNGIDSYYEGSGTAILSEILTME